TIAASDAHNHAPARDQLQRREQAGGTSQVPNRGVCNARPELHLSSSARHQCQERVGLLPQHVRVEDPSVFEARALGLFRKAENSLDLKVWFDSDAEIHAPLPPRAKLV